jgi:hypothetical protein
LVPAILCVVNWISFLIFLFARPPIVVGEMERDLRRSGTSVVFRQVDDVAFHIAGRPVYAWNSWHGGEKMWIRTVELLNAPALALARLLSPTATRTLFARSGSYWMESWVLAWLFLVAASVQWIVVGRLLAHGFSRSTRRITGNSYSHLFEGMPLSASNHGEEVVRTGGRRAVRMGRRESDIIFEEEKRVEVWQGAIQAIEERAARLAQKTFDSNIECERGCFWFKAGANGVLADANSHNDWIDRLRLAPVFGHSRYRPCR